MNIFALQTIMDLRKSVARLESSVEHQNARLDRFEATLLEIKRSVDKIDERTAAYSNQMKEIDTRLRDSEKIQSRMVGALILGGAIAIARWFAH